MRDWLRYAESLTGKLMEEFWDPEDGGLFLSSSDDPNIFLRRKTASDDAAPSANALAAMGLAELSSALGERSYMERAREIVACFARAAALRPLDHLSLITASGMLRPVRAAEAEAETDEGREPPAEAAEAQSEEAPVPAAEPREDEGTPRSHPERSRRDRAAARSERRLSRTRRSGLRDR